MAAKVLSRMKPESQTVNRSQDEVWNTIRRFRDDGYSISDPPDFLCGATFDFTAHKDDDHVVVRVKAGNELIGATDIIDLAKRIEGRDGWRFELVVWSLSYD